LYLNINFIYNFYLTWSTSWERTPIQTMTEPNLTYKTVWRLNDPHAKSDAISLWRSLNILPPGTEDDRASSLCIVAYDASTNNNKLAAVSTVGIEYSSLVRAKVAWFRCLVKEEYRKSGVATELAYRCRVHMEKWAKKYPEEDVMAFGTLVENPYLKHL
jgi:hypothetical protein